MAYIPCIAHNLQLVIKDGLKLSKRLTDLIDRVSRDIVSKSKSNLLIAEELRKLDKKLNKKNVTRWNSILFMIRSVLKLTPEDMKKIQSLMPVRTEKQRDYKKSFYLSLDEREMLTVTRFIRIV